jgi:hypothetical protein
MPPPILVKERTPALVACAALVAMLGVHIVLRTQDDLSPWKGGGFAMFSTIDSPGLRTVSVWADVAGVEERVSLVGRWDDASRELRSLPTPARTAALARGVAASPLVRRADGNLETATDAAVPMLLPTTGPGTPVTASATVPATTVVDVRRVRVDVMRLSFEDGFVRATLLESAAADTGLDG